MIFGSQWSIIRGARRGNWRSRLIVVAQALVGFVALLGLLAMVTLDPLVLLIFTAAQGFIVVGAVLFVIVALFAQRTLMLEDFGSGEVIIREGDLGRHVYVIRSGAVDVLVKQPDGSQQMIRQLGAGDHFGELALLRNAPRNATVKTVTETQVYKMSPDAFVALYTSLPDFREAFNKTMAARLEELERVARNEGSV